MGFFIFLAVQQPPRNQDFCFQLTVTMGLTDQRWQGIKSRFPVLPRRGGILQASWEQGTCWVKQSLSLVPLQSSQKEGNLGRNLVPVSPLSEKDIFLQPLRRSASCENKLGRKLLFDKLDWGCESHSKFEQWLELKGVFFFLNDSFSLLSFLKKIAPGERIGIQVDGESFSSLPDSDGEFLSSFACQYSGPS